LIREKHLLIADHTRKYLRDEHYFPGPTINRANRARWEEEGKSTLFERARAEVKRLLGEYEPTALSADKKDELLKLMRGEATRHGLDKLPGID
jgi:trimethylamine:corrinoid methyltransferase-like protein